MPRFVYEQERASKEYRSAKEELRNYYRWRFGYKVPFSWTADHQVEQSVYLYERFGGAYIHNIANMLFVPPEVNIGKNVAYGKPWPTAPAKLRNRLPRTVQLVELKPTKPCQIVLAKDGECVEVRSLGNRPDNHPSASQAPERPLAIREVLYMYSRLASDIRTWSFLEEASREFIWQIDRELSETRWKNDPPDWLQKYPRWLERFRDELETHEESVIDYLRHKSS